MRAFAIRFAGVFVLGGVGMAIALVLPGDVPSPGPWIPIALVGFSVVVAGAAFVSEQLNMDENTFGHDERTVKQLLWVDKERARAMREERRFRNSATSGVVQIGLGAWFAGSAWFLGDNSLAYASAALLFLTGGSLIWRGFRRWRAGGEFNLPGSAGPIYREPPRETRGD